MEARPFFMPGPDFNSRVRAVVTRYLERDADSRKHLSLLRWQLEANHALDSRDTYPGHITTSAIILTLDGRETLLIDHKTLKRWLQPGGHYEPAPHFWQSALREAEEETGLAHLSLHPWHQGADEPFLIDSHEVPGKASRGERSHVHHDLQFLFVAKPASALTAQLDEVSDVRWFPLEALKDIAPRALSRLSGMNT